METVRIGLLGFGNVGTGVYKILRENGPDIIHREGLDIRIEKILVRDTNKKRSIDIDKAMLTDSIEDIINNPEISIVAEFIGGTEPAKDYILKALEKGKISKTAYEKVCYRNALKLLEGVGIS